MTFIRFLNMAKTHWLTTVLFALILLAAVKYVQEHGFKAIFKGLNVNKAVFFAYLAFILLLAVFGRGTSVDPLSSVFANFWPIDWEVEENFLAFIPIGFTVLWAYTPKQPMRTAVLYSFCVSAFIELSQLLSCLGTFQLSDLMYNTLGGAVGGGMYLLTMFLVKEWKDKVNRGRRENHS